MKTMNFLYVAIGIAAFVTIINWIYFPGLRMAAAAAPPFVDYGSRPGQGQGQGYFMCPMCQKKLAAMRGT